MLATALLFTACKKDDDDNNNNVDVASTYSGDFDKNPPSTLTASDNLESIASDIKKGQDDFAITESYIVNLYDGGSLSLKDMASSAFDSWATDLFESTEKASTASYTNKVEIDFTDLAASPDGGGAGKRLLDGEITEPGQLIEKGAFGGVQYHYVKNTLFANPASVSQDNLDQALALFGSVPSFEENRFSAKYANARTLNDGTYLDQIAFEFRKAQSAINQGVESEKVAAVNAITTYWEEALMAQAVYYLHAASDQFADNSLDYDDDGYIGAIHGWSEAIGFVRGFYMVEGTTISDTEIKSILTKINAPIGGDYDVMSLIGSPTEVADLNTAIGEIAAVYGFDEDLHK